MDFVRWKAERNEHTPCREQPSESGRKEASHYGENKASDNQNYHKAMPHRRNVDVIGQVQDCPVEHGVQRRPDDIYSQLAGPVTRVDEMASSIHSRKILMPPSAPENLELQQEQQYERDAGMLRPTP